MGGISVLVLLGIGGTILMILLGIILLLIIKLLIEYIFESIFIYNQCKKLKYKYPILSWIPIYNKIRLGKIADKNNVGIALFVLDIILTSLSIFIYRNLVYLTEDMVVLILQAIFVLILLCFILNMYLSHNIIKKATPKFAVLLNILNIFTFGFLRPIVLFIIRNNEKINVK